MWHGMHWMGLGWWGWILGIIVIGGIVALVIWLVNRSVKSPHSSRDSALEILKQRYARGEISRMEFDEMKRDLT